ncbi:hypothetical protein ANANG_G00042960 [Anguilla anguilla]|uniref:RING-type E3 ubiquitin transferase n=1 Tax=Anguilla anguilla TaxID=7936 RepID=A0A9D3MTQ9_ANGAN|nr:hypothetical protein ANANG_G00042960 [Anguilla anguilla]
MRIASSQSAVLRNALNLHGDSDASLQRLGLRRRKVNPHRMFNSWARQAAESLTNAQHMREVRQRIDLDHQEHLRRREQERAEAELKRETHPRRLPAPPLLNKHRARTYDRPWAKNTAGTKKPSSTSDRVHEPRAGHLSNRSCASKLPVIARRAQTQTLTVSGKTQRRAPATATQLGKVLPPPCHKQNSVNEKNAGCKLAPSKDFYSPRRTQSRRPREAPSQEMEKDKPKVTLTLSRQALSPIRGLDSSSVPLPLSSPDWTPVDWSLMSSLHCRSPSPVDESDLQLISHPFQECMNESSIGEDIGDNETSGSRILCGTDLSVSSADSGISRSSCPSNSGGTPENSLSDEFRSLDLLPSQYRGENDPLPTWVNPESGGDPSPPSCSPLRSTRTPVLLEPPVRLENRLLGETDRASFRGGYSPVPPIAEAGSLSSLAAISERTHGDRLPAPTAEEHLDRQISDPSVGPTRAPWGQLSSAGPESGQETAPAEGSPATATGRRSLDGVRLEEREDGGGASMSGASVGVASRGPRTSGLLDHLALALMALQEVRREVVQIHLDSTQERSGGAAETKPPADPETLRRITESLLEEESDEEEGDLCRICQSWGGTPQNPLLTPCRCTGSLQYVHHDCLKRWIQAKVQSGAELTAVKACELCKASLNLDLEGFDLEECYRQRQAQVEQASPELHVLRLLQQRLWDVVHAVETRSYATFNVATALYLIHQTAGSTSVRLMVASPESARTGHQRMAQSEETSDP